MGDGGGLLGEGSVQWGMVVVVVVGVVVMGGGGTGGGVCVALRGPHMGWAVLGSGSSVY